MAISSNNIHCRKTSSQQAAARERRRLLVQVRMTADELAALDAYAAGLGLDRSKAIRYAVMHGNATRTAGGRIADFAEIFAGLNAIKRSSSGIGNNVNQMARAANAREQRQPGSVGDLVMNGLLQDALRAVAEAIEQQNAEISAINEKLGGML